MLEVSIGAMTLGLRTHAGNTRLTEFLDISADFGPSVLPTYELESLVLTEMPRKHMVVLVLHNAEAEVVGIGDVNPVVEAKETGRINRPVAFRIRKVFSSNSVRGKSGNNVGMQRF